MEQTDKALCVDVYVCVYVGVCRVIATTLPTQGSWSDVWRHTGIVFWCL